MINRYLFLYSYDDLLLSFVTLQFQFFFLTIVPCSLYLPRFETERNLLCTFDSPRIKIQRWANGVGSVPALSGIVVAFVRRFVSPRLVLSRGRGRRRSYRAEVARSTRRKIRSPSFRTRPTPMPILSGRGWLETARTSNATSIPTLAPTLVTLSTALRPSLT